MLERAYTTTAYKVEYTHNNFGEKVESSSAERKIWFREITNIDRQNKMEVATSDAMFRDTGDSGWAENDILKVDTQYYRITKITYAKKLGSTKVEFVKGLLQKQEPIS